MESFPRRHVVRVELDHRNGAWIAREVDCLADTDTPAETGALGDAPPFELELAEKLEQYSALIKGRGRRGARMVLIRLQQRLLSSVEAFARTLALHARHVGERAGDAYTGDGHGYRLPIEATPADDDDDDADAHGLDDDEIEARDASRVAAASRRLEAPPERALRLLAEMRQTAERFRGAPDAKARALLAWIRRHQCPAARFGGAAIDVSSADRQWSDRRLIVFTEFGDTLSHLQRLLSTAFEGTDRGAERLLTFRGGIGDARREEIQRAFNGPPEEYPVRLLLATDAAREGVNLQGYCADLLHFDVPWNPARLEQRNGRIDRTLQSSADVYCRYFVYPRRREDRILDTLVRKVDVIQREVGSLGTVILDRIEKALAAGIDEHTGERLERAEALSGRGEVAKSELESTRQLRALERQIAGARATTSLSSPWRRPRSDGWRSVSGGCLKTRVPSTRYRPRSAPACSAPPGRPCAPCGRTSATKPTAWPIRPRGASPPAAGRRPPTSGVCSRPSGGRSKSKSSVS